MLDDQPDQPQQDSQQDSSPGTPPDPPKVTTTTRRRTTRRVTPTSSPAASPDPGDGASTGEATAPKAAAKTTAKKTAAKKTPAKKAPAKKTAARKATTEATPESGTAESSTTESSTAEGAPEQQASAKKTAAKKTAAKKAPAAKAPAKKTAAKKTPAKKAAAKKATSEAESEATTEATGDATADAPTVTTTRRTRTARAASPAPLFQAPETVERKPAKKGRAKADEQTSDQVTEDVTGDATGDADGTTASTSGKSSKSSTSAKSATSGTSSKSAKATKGQDADADAAETDASSADQAGSDSGQSDDAGEEGTPKRRRRRGGRRRRKSGGSGDSGDGQGESGRTDGDSDGDANSDGPADDQDGDQNGEGGSSRRRRRRRRAGEDGAGSGDDPQNTVTKVRKGRSAEDQITSLSGSTRLEAKKQRRREGREAGRRRAPIVSEAEFLARRESVDRTMVVRQRDDLTQIAVLEDKVLVEHYVARESQTSLIGNVYLGRVQNVLPSMEAAFIDIGKGRNAVLYAGEVNWSALGHKDGQPRKIESVLQSGQSVLVQVTKDPVGHKGARLTSQISLPGRFLVYVPDGTTSGISRKLPDTERSRLKSLLKEIVPDSAGVIVRTAAEGATEEQLTRDVERLTARWDDIEAKTKGSAPQLLYGEPDLTVKVIRDLFTEDFSSLVVDGADAWDTVHGYVAHVAPDLEERLERFEPATEGKKEGLDAFAVHRIDEQIKKGLDRKVWLPSGGSLIIDRTEAMTVVDVNTGKFTGSGGNLEETVTRNNLEAAEEIVRQLRLRDIGGIIVVDFIDMVLESNRDLVVRRLVECLGRDRTRHQVAEVTSLGLVQMTRKRIGTGLLEAFSHSCEHCQGRGVVVEDAPVEPSSKPSSKRDDDGGGRRGRRSRGGRSKGGDSGGSNGNGSNGNGSNGARTSAPSPADVAAMSRKPSDQADQADQVDQAAADQSPPDAPDAVEPADVAAEAGEPGQADTDRATSAESTATPAASAAEPAVQEEPAQDAPAPQKPAGTGAVVTRSRRRASRPAGPPPGGEEAATGAEPVEPAAEPAAEPTTEQAAEPAEDSAVGPMGEQAPAGVGTPPVHGGIEPGTVEVEPGPTDGSTPADEPQVAHVPVKRKGSRKR